MTSPDGPIAILGAMAEELAALLEVLEERSDRRVSGHDLHSGRLEGRHVLLGLCGIGKVNAAATAQLMALEQPRALIFTGVAGALDPGLDVGDIVVASDAVQHDVDVSALGYEPGRIPGEPLAWPSDPALIDLAVAAAAELTDVRVERGRVASGDQFVADRDRTASLRERFGASCVEMEGAAVAQVCARAGLPFVIIRSISDNADHDAEVSFREFTLLAAGRAKALVRALLRTMPVAASP
ncbi:MAG: 5'-methylthioadenosine/adenosylhomocysteine nucleosidase [Trueperaceae bacterium]